MFHFSLIFFFSLFFFYAWNWNLAKDVRRILFNAKLSGGRSWKLIGVEISRQICRIRPLLFLNVLFSQNKSAFSFDQRQFSCLFLYECSILFVYDRMGEWKNIFNQLIRALHSVASSIFSGRKSKESILWLAILILFAIFFLLLVFKIF